MAAAWFCWPCAGLAGLVVGAFGSAGPHGRAPCSAGGARSRVVLPAAAVNLLAKQIKLYYPSFKFNNKLLLFSCSVDGFLGGWVLVFLK